MVHRDWQAARQAGFAEYTVLQLHCIFWINSIFIKSGWSQFANLQHHVYCFFHVLYRYPFVFGMYGLSPAKGWGRQTFMRKYSSICTPSDGPLFGIHPYIFNGFYSNIHHPWMLVQHIFHIAILFCDGKFVTRMRIAFVIPFTDFIQIVFCSSNLAVTKSLRINSIFADSNFPSMELGWIKPCMPSVASGHKESLGNWATISKQFWWRFHFAFAYPGWALTPVISMTALLAENFQILWHPNLHHPGYNHSLHPVVACLLGNTPAYFFIGSEQHFTSPCGKAGFLTIW